MKRLFGHGQDVRALGRAKLAAIGPATAQALREYGLAADLVPPDFRAEGLIEALGPRLAPGTKVLLARAQVAREVLPQGLMRLGVEVDVAPVYKARHVTEIPPEAQAALQEGKVDILTFTSSATVHNFVLLVGKERFQSLAKVAVVAAIGPITGGTLKEYGITPQVQPETYTIPALAEAIVKYFQKLP
jgi:uroporphyrinogen III methyltransferase/synthase